MSGYCSTQCQVCEAKCQVKGQSNYGCCESPNGQGCSGCMDICMDCQTACEWSAQGCQTTCEKSCQSRCERGCQDNCERRCQSSCQGSCQTTCESGCQSGAEKNSRPSSPGGVSIQNPIRSGKPFNISWGYASDSDGNLKGYKLERSIDNGSYNQVYDGNYNSYTDTVPKGAKTVRYRVRAYDTYSASSGYTYSQIITVVNNSSPIISGSNFDYGAVTNNFTINYIVTDTDEGDRVEIKIAVDGETTQDFTETSLGVRKSIDVNLEKYSLGKHKIEITARDKEGETYTRVYTFEKINTAPSISGKDENLGEKNTAFTYTYKVNDAEGDKVNIIERVAGKIVRTLTNATKNTDLYITVTDEMLKTYTLGENITIEVEADDGKGGVSYRRATFKRSNFAPVISGQDVDLGELDKELEYSYTVTDMEGDEIYAEVTLDGRVIEKKKKIKTGIENKIILKGLSFLSIPRGRRLIKIITTDDKGARSERNITFTRVAKRLIMKLKAPIETGATAAKKIYVTPNWAVAAGAEGRIEVCNNGFDTSPTWEDATSMAKAGLDFKFRNTTKTAAKFGIDIRIVIERKEAKVDSYFNALGGSFE